MIEGVEYIIGLTEGDRLECEVFGEDTAGMDVEIHRGAAESIERFIERGIGIRVVDGNRAGYSFTSDLSELSLRNAFGEAADISKSSSPSARDVLADPLDSQGAAENREDIELATGTGVILKALAEMEDAALSHSAEIVNTQNVSYTERRSSVTVGSSRGFIRSEARGYASFSMSAISKKGNESRSDWYQGQAPDFSAIDWVGVGREAARRSASLLGSRKIPGGRYQIVFDSMAFIDILEFIEEIISAEMVIRGISVLEGKVGGRVASKEFDLVDDPEMKEGLFSSTFDDEGVPRRKYRLINRGVLMGYLHNSMTARWMDVEPTGNATRSSFKVSPVPGGTNLYLQAGKSTSKDLVSSIDEGILVQDIMGMHTADSVSGDFSVGVSGHYVRSGSLIHPVCEVTVSGNILDLLGGVTGVGDEVLFVGGTGSPAVLIEGLSLSGK